MRNLRAVYSVPTEEAALITIDRLEESWGKKYSLAIKTRRNNGTHAPTFLKYPDKIRKMLYTTNAVEALHRQFRKVTKAKSIFPNDDALKKMLFLAYRDLSKKWAMQVQNWALVISHLSVTFEERFENVL